jgi:DNA-binding NarL/FixJ family response regulator
MKGDKMNKINLLVCDDHEILRKGIVQLLNLQKNFHVIGEAKNGDEAVKLSEDLKPDVILMDIQMPVCNGLEAVERIRKYDKEIKIIMLTVSDNDEDLYNAIKVGANGFLLKNMNLDDLFIHINSVIQGEASFSPGLANKILKEFNNMANQIKSNKVYQYNLSKREMDVLKLVVKGYSNAEIGEELFITEHTVKKHLGSILEKLHVKNRHQAANLALNEGIITLD